MNTLLTRISDVFEISSPFIPKEDLIHMSLVYPLLSRAPLTRIRFRMKVEISSPVWPTGVHTYPVKTAFKENASFQKFSPEWRFFENADLLYLCTQMKPEVFNNYHVTVLDTITRVLPSMSFRVEGQRRFKNAT